MSATLDTSAVPLGTRNTVVSNKRRNSPWIYVFLTAVAVLWLIPLVWTLYTSLRPNAATTKLGYFSVGGGLTFSNFGTAWNSGFGTYLINSAIITVPAVVITLFLASCVAFAVSRFAWRFNVVVLILFTAGNLLPPQILATPIYQLFKNIPLPLSVSDSGSLLNTYYGVIIMNVAFQIGFCTFVLSNYMKALPDELGEAARVDGASVWRQYRSIILPLCRPALGALATLEVIWIYNDFFWALLLVQSGDRLPVTTAINNLKGEFVNNYNLIAAGAMITVIPTLIIYFVLQRQFVAGLTLGASKG
ncbi:ABC transporter permease [Frondihabitans sucicola]|uniref:ABC transporter permease n=1 Tax=Frondihabitans sucicola TaxID=1268041 RepID=A0ABN6Y1R4_9MICO|nr:carbohydrate ABC transporter permease [Frondihabitans sucicola]BDZ50976.1 ABC transporter permease [Frondihabitans sucicola]